MPELEAENQLLKLVYAKLSLEYKVLKDIVEKKCDSGSASVAAAYKLLLHKLSERKACRLAWLPITRYLPTHELVC